MHLILYSKPGCHLCEALLEKLQQIPSLEIETRDITAQEDWFAAYQYEIPVLHLLKNGEVMTLPRISPRASVEQVAKILARY